MDNLDTFFDRSRQLVLDNLKWAGDQATTAAGRFEKATEQYAKESKVAIDTVQEAVDYAVKQQIAMTRRASETFEQTMQLWKDAFKAPQV